MKAVGVIPARYASTRFPGKPLAPILGKPMIAWVIEAALKARELDQVLVATDDNRIASAARAAGAAVVMTDSSLPSGSDRTWAAVEALDCDVVLNIQGDEPLLDPAVLDLLARHLKDNAAVEMATLGRKMEEKDLGNLNTAKIVLNERGEAIYFSRFAIPYSRDVVYDENACLKHVGIYGFQKYFLKKFCASSPCLLEQKEGLEQLRALYLGARIAVLKVNYDSWGVDNPQDISVIEEKLKVRGKVHGT